MVYLLNMVNFHGELLNNQMVNPNKSHSIPLNPIKPPSSYGFPMVFLWFSDMCGDINHTFPTAESRPRWTWLEDVGRAGMP